MPNNYPSNNLIDFIDETSKHTSIRLSIDFEIITWNTGGYGIAGHLLINPALNHIGFPKDDNNKVYETEELAQSAAQEWYIKELKGFIQNIDTSNIKQLPFKGGCVELEVVTSIIPHENKFKIIATLSKGLGFMKYDTLDILDSVLIGHDAYETLNIAELAIDNIVKTIILNNLVITK